MQPSDGFGLVRDDTVRFERKPATVWLTNLDLKAHGAAGRYYQCLVNLLGAHRRVQRAQKELEKTRAANVN